MKNRADLRRFINLPWSIYRDDPDWVPPLRRDVRAAFDPAKHPFHLHSEVLPWLALRGRQVVGRICAIRNRNHERVHEEAVGFFGWFECIDDPEVVEGLFEAVRGWLRQRGLTAMRGPTSFSTNETTGLLVNGDRGSPALLLAHNPPWYPALLEGCGLRKVRDLHAWHIVADSRPEHLIRAEKLVTRRYGIRIRTLDMSRFDEELALIRRLYNSAWRRNWGFVPMTDAEIDHTAAELKPIIDPNLVLFAETPAEEVIGVAVALPDFNQVLHKLNGRLTPLGIIKLLIHKRRISRLRVLMLGLLQEWRGRGIDALLHLALFRNAVAAGMREADLSWILEDNHRMNAAVKRLGGSIYRTYRVYEAPV